ncbi:Transmembrane protein [Quillaja saponaria]|uniref:Transmembrane protein n=1 Tax=Quillaja saponaria TaxID=32244 RepID=A0AAD7PQR4_QUISA|nr:Transmembrane protein [Quillaja saponaria]
MYTFSPSPHHLIKSTEAKGLQQYWNWHCQSWDRLENQMDPRLWHKVAAVSGMVALGLGTYGAHGFKPKNPTYKEVWQTASLYHLVHTAALLAAPITKHPNIFGGLLTAGIIAFSGTRGILAMVIHLLLHGILIIIRHHHLLAMLVLYCCTS